MSVNPRMNRLFTQNGKCLQVALDHGIANEASFLNGIENMKQVVGAIAAANPDAILVSTGQAHWLQDLAQKPKPALVLRMDATNFYGVPTPTVVYCKLLADAVEQAVALDAAAIVVNLFWSPDQPDLHGQCVENVIRVKPQCERFGMPLMVEPMILVPDEKGGYKVNPDINRTVALARQAVELGADIVKADIAENVSDYHRVVKAASPRPLLPRGGARVPDREVLTRTHTLVQQGASGAILHDGADVDRAMKILEEIG
jgi:class I fructose-bisphosphate aldolase